MGHKIFISYKYADDNVAMIDTSSYPNTARSYVDVLQTYIEESNHIYKAEQDNDDLSELSDDAIWQKLKDRIFDSTLTIVLISAGMREFNKRDRDQWIPWEISYSLKEVNRKNVNGDPIKSSSNAILALVIPDKFGQYDFFIKQNYCCSSPCRTLQTGSLFNILQENMFNILEPDVYSCSEKSKIYRGDASYIYSVKWVDFVKNPELYINKAYEIQSAIKKYKIKYEVD